jgi:hypothetical protein
LQRKLILLWEAHQAKIRKGSGFPSPLSFDSSR